MDAGLLDERRHTGLKLASAVERRDANKCIEFAAWMKLSIVNHSQAGPFLHISRSAVKATLRLSQSFLGHRNSKKKAYPNRWPCKSKTASCTKHVRWVHHALALLTPAALEKLTLAKIWALFEKCTSLVTSVGTPPAGCGGPAS